MQSMQSTKSSSVMIARPHVPSAGHAPGNVIGLRSSLPPQSLSARPQALQMFLRLASSAFSSAGVVLPSLGSGHGGVAFPTLAASQHLASALDLAIANFAASLPTAAWHLLRSLSVLGSVVISGP